LEALTTGAPAPLWRTSRRQRLRVNQLTALILDIATAMRCASESMSD